jgi:hypothetical protein
MMIDGINQLPAPLPKGHDGLTVATPHLSESDQGKTEIFGDKNLWSLEIQQALSCQKISSIQPSNPSCQRKKCAARDVQSDSQLGCSDGKPL